MTRLAVLVLLCACGARTTPSNTKAAEAGVTLSLYSAGDKSYGVVDDRRFIEVTGSSILLDNIDPGAALASLVIETTTPGLRIGPCTRDRLPDLDDDALEEFGREQERLSAERLRRRIERTLPDVNRTRDIREDVRRPTPAPGQRFAPVVSCNVAGPRGRHLVRIVYVSPALTYRAQHDIEMTESERASIASRFALVTPPWRTRASVILFDGAPGGDKPPVELVRGDVTLDGGTSVLVLPTRNVTARIRRIFAADTADELSEDPLWGPSALAGVWATLEAPGVTLPPGAVRVHVELPDEGSRWIDVPPSRRMQRADDASAKAPLRLMLWLDDTLRATRERRVIEDDGVRMLELFAAVITNTGDRPREVWVEDRLRNARRRSVERSWPAKPTAVGDVVRHKIEVRPGRVARTGFTVAYEQ